MAMTKKSWAVLTCFLALILSQPIFAQDDLLDSLNVQNQLPPALDSLDNEIERTTQEVPPLSLKEVEEEVIKLEHQFFDTNAQIWKDPEVIYQYNNVYYLPFYQQNPHLLSNIQLDNLFYTTNNLLSLRRYYTKEESAHLKTKFETVSVPFEPMLAVLQFSAGEHNTENKYLHLQKNNFLHLSNLRVFIHSGSHNSPWGNKNYFDDFVLQLDRKMGTHRIGFHFIKQFSDQDVFIPFNRFGTLDLFPRYHRKFAANTGVFDMALFNNILEFSYMHQSGYEKIVEPSTASDKYEFKRNQLTLGISSPYESDDMHIIFGLDSHHYKNFESIRQDTFTDYFINLFLTAPGFRELFTIKLFGQVYVSDVFDTTFIYTHLSSDISTGPNHNINLGIGSIGNPHSANALGSGILYYENRRCPLTNFGELSWTLSPSTAYLKITPYIAQTRYDYQWILQDSLIYQELDDYVNYGIKGEADIEYDLLGLDNTMRLKIDFTNYPDTLVFRPNFKLKFIWNIRQLVDTGYNNYVYLAPCISYIKDFRNMEFIKESDELFFDLEVGINISRFRISASIKNILNREYFMDPGNLINGRSAHFNVHWNFIN